MYIVSFNINSVRARIHQLTALVECYQPTVIGLQETKVQDHEFPLDELNTLGYQIITHGQKGHYRFGSVTEKVVKNSPIPVTTIPLEAR